MIKQTFIAMAALATSAATAGCSGNHDGEALGGDLVFGDAGTEPGFVLEEPLGQYCPYTGDGIDSRGLTLAEASLFYLPSEKGYTHAQPGNLWGFPPENDEPRAWKDRVPAEGAVIQPGETWVLATVVKVRDPDGSLERIQVVFKDDDGDIHNTWAHTASIRPELRWNAGRIERMVRAYFSAL